MTLIQSLTQKRQNLLIEYNVSVMDYKEYIKNPVETVDLLHLKHQIEFVVNEIKNLDFQIKNQILVTMESLKLDLKNLQTLYDVHQKKLSDLNLNLLPPSLIKFDDLLTTEQIKLKLNI